MAPIKDKEIPGDGDTTAYLPTISAATKIKTTTGTIWAVGGAFAAAIIWCALMYADMQALKRDNDEKTAQLKQLTAQLLMLSQKVDRLTWALEQSSQRR